MEAQTFIDPIVVAELHNWIVVKVSVNDQPDLAKAFNVSAIPTVVLLQPNRKEIARAAGFMPPTDFVRFIKEHRVGY
jgi:thioredoxin-like negative regulator of GroEL